MAEAFGGKTVCIGEGNLAKPVPGALTVPFSRARTAGKDFER